MRRPDAVVPNLAIGQIIEVDGSHIVAELSNTVSELSVVHAGETYAIGQFGSIVRVHFGRTILYALVSRLRMKSEFFAEQGAIVTSNGDERVLEADLLGQGVWLLEDRGGAGKAWHFSFDRGVTTFPLPQQTLYLTPKSELREIYANGKTASMLEIGTHIGAAGAPCLADMNELLGKHSAILGSTGSGKSGTVASVLHSILDHQASGSEEWMPQIVVLDPHNEYQSAFAGSRRLSTDDGSLRLPYWLLSFQETLELFIGKAENAATSQANIVKNSLLAARKAGALTIGLDPDKITVDSPVPYEIEEVRRLIEDSKPNAASSQGPYNSILEKIDTLQRDSRMDFLMDAWTAGDGDGFSEVFEPLIASGQPIHIVDLAGVPNEVASICSAVIARSLFTMKVWQTREERESSPVLLVCEEAHRYVPNSGQAQYESAKDAIRRIAKEGRKYGIALMIVSQRPSEVEATVLSQCNSWLILRTTNEADRAHVRGMLPDSTVGMLSTLSSLRRQEAIFVGQAAVLPSRVMIRTLTKDQLPKSADIDFERGWKGPGFSADSLNTIATRWRYQDRPIP